MRQMIAAVLIAAWATACAPTQPPAPAPEADPNAAPAGPPATGAVLPAQTEIQLVLSERVSADSSRIGDRFTATVRDRIVAQNGQVVLEEGTMVTGMITGVKPGASAGDQAAVRLNFLRFSVDGVTHPFTADILRVRVEAGDAPTEPVSDAGARAAHGAVITGDLRDELAAAFGRGAGSIVSLGSGDVTSALPAGTVLTVRNRDTLRLREM